MEQATTTTKTDNKSGIDNLFDLENTIELTQNLFRVDEAEQKEFLTFKINMK